MKRKPQSSSSGFQRALAFFKSQESKQVDRTISPAWKKKYDKVVVKTTKVVINEVKLNLDIVGISLSYLESLSVPIHYNFDDMGKIFMDMTRASKSSLVELVLNSNPEFVKSVADLFVSYPSKANWNDSLLSIRKRHTKNEVYLWMDLTCYNLHETEQMDDFHKAKEHLGRRIKLIGSSMIIVDSFEDFLSKRKYLCILEWATIRLNSKSYEISLSQIDEDYFLRLVHNGNIFELFNRVFDTLKSQIRNEEEKIEFESLQKLDLIQAQSTAVIMMKEFFLQLIEQAEKSSTSLEQIAGLLNAQSFLYQSLGSVEAAISLSKKALDQLRLLINNERMVIINLHNLARLHVQSENFGEAQILIEESLAISKTILGNSNEVISIRIWLGEVLKYQRKYEEAELIFKSVVDSIRIQGTEHKDYVPCVSQLAELYCIMDRYDEAISMFKLAIEISRNSLSSDSIIDFTKLLRNLGFLLHQTGQFDEALSSYREAEYLDGSASLSDLDSQFSLYYDMGKFSDALAIVQQVIEIHEKQDEINTFKAINALEWQSTLLQFVGRVNEAKKILEKVVQMRKTIQGVSHLEYAQSIDALAVLYQKLGLFGQALEFQIEAVNLYKQLVGLGHPDYANSIDHLALLHSKMGNSVQALTLCEQALDIRKQIFGLDHPEYSCSLTNLAWILQSMGRHDETLHLLQEAQRIQLQAVGEKHSDYALCVNNLAEWYKTKGRYKEAMKLHRKALEIYSSLYTNEKHWQLAMSLSNNAGVLTLMGQYEEALKLYEQALKIDEELLGPNNFETAGDITNLAYLNEKIGNFDSAMELINQALSIYENSVGLHYPDAITAQELHGIILQSQGNFEQAEIVLKKVIAIREQVQGTDHPLYAASLGNLGVLFLSINRLEDAEHLIRKSLEIDETSLERDHIDYALDLNSLAEILRENGKFSQSLKLYNVSLSIVNKVLGKQHPFSAILSNNIGLLYFQMGNFELSQSFYRNALSILEKIDHPFCLNTKRNISLLVEFGQSEV